MGEHEQGGMLRVVIVLGLIAIVSFAVIASVIAFKPGLRRNIVNTAALGQNILDVNQQGTDRVHKFNLLTGDTVMKWDKTTNVYSLTFAAKPDIWQGMYYGTGGSLAPTDYMWVLKDDRYSISAEMRTDQPELVSSLSYSIYFESGKDEYIKRPVLSDTWQLYETRGVRVGTGGVPIIVFKNQSGQPATVQIRNVEVHRVVY